MRAPESLNHIAYPTWDTAQTHRFYTEILGCPFLTAIELDQVPSTGVKTRYLHTFYGLSSGGAIAFFEVEGVQRPPDDGLPSWIRHIALNVPSMAALSEWERHLRDKGVALTGVVDHDGVWSSLYFFDPNGIRIELTYQATELTDRDLELGEARLRAWIGHHEATIRANSA